MFLGLVDQCGALQVAVEMAVVGAEQTAREVVGLEVGDEPLHGVGIEQLAVVRAETPLDLQRGFERRHILRCAAGAKVADLRERELARLVQAEEQLAGADPDFDLQRVGGLGVVDPGRAAR